MSIKIEHRNLEIRKTRNDFFIQVRNFLLPLSLKVLRHKEREAQSLYPDFFICSQSRAAPATRPCELAKGNRLLPRQVSSQLTDFFKKNLNPPRSSGAWRHSHCVTSFPIPSFCDISEWHVRSARARAWTAALMLHLSNPCTEPKGSQPN